MWLLCHAARRLTVWTRCTVDAQLPDAEDEEEDAPSVVVATIFVIADLDSPDGRALARSALELLVRLPVSGNHPPPSLH